MITPTVLIIEDTVDIAEMYRHVFTMVGFDCKLVLSGKMAEKSLDEEVPDLIILDLRLENDQVASQLLARVRGDERFDRTAIFIATGHPRLAEPLQETADLVLQKPIDIRFLTQMAIKLVSRNYYPEDDSGEVVSINLIDRKSFVKRLADNLEELENFPGHFFLLFLIRVQPIGAHGDEEFAGALQAEVRAVVIKRLLTHTRLGDTLALLDQKLYGVILYYTNQLGDAWPIANRLIDHLKTPVSLRDRRINLKISIGASVSDPQSRAEDMFRTASDALTEAKGFQEHKFILRIKNIDPKNFEEKQPSEKG
jgi:PleD family two-component response regulator